MEGRAPARRARNHQARRDQIRQAARVEFSRRGYHATQVSDIVARAGIARGTFYYHYDGKREVFGDVLERIVDLLDNNLGSIDSTRPIRPQILINVGRLLRTLVDNVDLARILLHEAVGLDEGADAQLTGFYDRLVTRLAVMLAEGQQVGFVRDGDPDVLAMCLLGTVKEATYQYLLGTRRPPVDTLVRELTRYALDGVARRESLEER